MLALETDKAFRAVPDDADWCFYIQADEVVHEQDHPAIRESMARYLTHRDVEGLLFDYVHFYGSFDYVGESYRWYRREIRIIRNDKNIFSYRDAQGFRIRPNRKLRVKHIPASIYHYGWVREPVAMRKKATAFAHLYRSDEWIKANTPADQAFDYSEIDALQRFTGTHPQVMHQRIKTKNWVFDYDLSRNKFSLKDRFKRVVERYTGWRPFEYRNYKIIR